MFVLGQGFGGANAPRPIVIGGPVNEAKKKNWMQDVKIKHPGICTGKKFGSKSCPAGSRQYELAKTFKKASRKNSGKKK